MDIKTFIYRLKYRYGKHLPLTVPVDVSLELSSICNMGCSYCYHSNPKELPFTLGHMPLEIAKKIIRESAAIGVNSIKFNWKGEGTLHPDYRNILTMAKGFASGSTFIDRLANSNFKISPKRRDDIFEGLAQLTKVKISYDSFDEKVFQAQRTGGIHSLTTKNIDLFYNHKARIKSETKMVIQAVRTSLNANEDIKGICKKRWPEAQVSIRDMVAGRVDNDLDSMELKERSIERQSCQQAHVRLIFNKGGIAFPCCPDVAEKLGIGSIERLSVYQLFNALPVKWLRQDLKTGEAFKRNTCKNCSSFESYKNYKPVWNS